MKVNKNISGVLIEDEVINRSSSALARLVHDTFRADSLEIWTGEGKTGTQLTITTDYTIGGKDDRLSTEATVDVNTTVAIVNGTFQNVDLYATYLTVGDYVEAEDLAPLTLINLLRPVGSQYRMVAVAEDNDPAVAFPVAERPETLFPGTTWELLWDSSSVYFRTEGTLADDGRVDGLQEDAMQRITGDYTLPSFGGENLSIANNPDGVYSRSTTGVSGARVDSTGTAIRGKLSFDNAESTTPNTAKTNDVETRVRNVLERVYRRTA